MDFYRDALGIDTGAPNPLGAPPGVTLDALSGTISITGNTGTVNDLDVRAADLRLLDSGGTFIRQPFASSKSAAADGESVRTTFLVYDSLGTPVEADLSMVLSEKSSTGTTWRYYFESPDDSDSLQTLSTGLVRFDTDGQLADPAPVTVTIDRAAGADSPLTFDVEFAGPQDSVTSLTSTHSEIAATFRDGSPLGTLAAFAVGQDGTITGTFTNGLTRTLGQVALAMFSNPEGLVDAGANLFRTGPNSGLPALTTPTSLGAGSLVGGALEQSNVDLSEEFTRMILASTGFSASSRVIRTTDELMQQLLVLGR
jgi:flagellar hook protein FlgE